MTFWEWVEIDASASPDYLADAPLAADLHAALRACPDELPFLAPVALTVPGGLAFLAKHARLLAADDLERAQREWTVLSPLYSRDRFTAAFPNATVQPIHGDAPSYNLIRTTSGIRYADFEDVTMGPPERGLRLRGRCEVFRFRAGRRNASSRLVPSGICTITQVPVERPDSYASESLAASGCAFVASYSLSSVATSKARR
jgi:hypothetical protein